LNAIPLDQILFTQSASGFSLVAPPPTITDLSTTGVLEMHYNYTPAAAAVPKRAH